MRKKGWPPKRGRKHKMAKKLIQIFRGNRGREWREKSRKNGSNASSLEPTCDRNGKGGMRGGIQGLQISPEVGEKKNETTG